MQLGFHGATTMTSDLETDVAVTAQAGYQALELWAGKLDRYLAAHSVAELKALLDDNHVAPMSINSIEFIAFRGDEYGEIQERCKELCVLAEAIRCPTVVVVPSPTPDRNMPWDDVVAEYVTVLRDLADIAAPHGIRLSFEFLGFGWCTVRTPRAAWEIVKKTGRDNVGMTVDCAHFFGGGGLMKELDGWIRRASSRFTWMTWRTPRRRQSAMRRACSQGWESSPWPRSARLKGIGYDGVCSIELFRPEYWGWNPLDVAMTARKAALAVLSPYFNVQ